ncbi:MAG: NADH-quinone oxidoreductase subunit NuoH [Anaerolineae bacterium]|nr:MAG: NADH-quinone oxidoreductase subunit NuoH [Anaerolineae bacterium]
MTFWNDPIHFIAEWLRGLFIGWGMSGDVANVLIALIGAVVLASVAMVLDILLVWVERKVVARFQDRLGPNRLGPFGLFQPFADILKLIIKENITPAGADKVPYNIAPILAMTAVLLLWAVLPLAPTIFGVDLNVGALYLIAAGALGTLAIILAGWSSNNKFALIGAFRAVAMMVSYEIPMVVTLLIPTILAGTMSLNGMVKAQDVWFVVLSPLAVIIFLISAVAELGRAPFDLNEAESELVAGYHVEYSGMKFGLFYAAELLHAFTFGGFMAVLFFGGWRGPWAEQYPLLGLLYFFVKAMIGYWVFMWIRYTMPRIRIDHMLAFNWKFLTPLAFVLLMVTALVDKALAGAETWVYALGMFLANVVVAWVTVEILRAYSRRRRLEEEAPAKQVIRTGVEGQAAHH